MIDIEKILQTKLESEISGFINRQAENAVQMLCASLSAKEVDLCLFAEANNIVVEYTEIGWFKDAAKTLTLDKQYSIKRSFNTGHGHSNSGAEKIGKAEIAVEIKSVGHLSNIDFTQKTAGKGVNIHSVRFELVINAQLKY